MGNNGSADHPANGDVAEGGLHTTALQSDDVCNERGAGNTESRADCDANDSHIDRSE